jgi:hypothetical protein
MSTGSRVKGRSLSFLVQARPSPCLAASIVHGLLLDLPETSAHYAHRVPHNDMYMLPVWICLTQMNLSHMSCFIVFLSWRLHPGAFYTQIYLLLKIHSKFYIYDTICILSFPYGLIFKLLIRFWNSK